VIRVNWSESIDPDKFADRERAIIVSLNGSEIAGEVAYILENRAMVFTPAAPLVANGNYQVTIQPATDLAGNPQSQGRTYSFATIDLQPPVIATLTASPGTTVRVGTTAVITAELEPAPDVAFVEFFVNGTSRLVKPAAPYTFSLAITKEMGTQVTVSARATDLAGNVSQPASLALTIQPDSAPQVTITAPAEGTLVSTGEQVQITVQAEDDAGLAQIFFQATGAVQTTETRVVAGLARSFTTNFFIDVPQNAAPGATIQLRASAKDTANQSGDSAPITLTVRDTAAPAAEITAPADGAKVEPGATVDVTVRATDNGALASITLEASGAATFSEERPVSPANSPAEVTFQVPVSASATVNDSVVLVARATDGAGNVSQQATITLGIKDVVAPAVTISLPEGLTDIASGQTIQVTVSASDQVSVVSLGLQTSGVMTGMETRAVTPPAGSASTTFSVTVPSDLTEGGELTLVGQATDQAGNTGSSSQVTLPVVVDSAPQVAITAPADGATINSGDQLTVTVQAADDLGLTAIRLRATGAYTFEQTQTVEPADTSHSATFVLDIPASALGEFQLEASARDTRGQITTTAPLTVTATDTVLPVVEIFDPANGDYVMPGGTAYILVLASDNNMVASAQLTASGALEMSETQAIDPPAPGSVLVFEVELPETIPAGESITFTIRATDVAGNVSQPASVQVLAADIVPPQTTLTLPEGLTQVRQGESYEVTVSATDNVELHMLALLTSGAWNTNDGESVPPGQKSASATFTLQVPFDAPIGSTVSVTGRGIDTWGNSGESEPVVLTVAAPATSVYGTVTDAAGDRVPGAEITVTATNGTFTGVANEQGEFTIEGIGRGQVTVRALNPATGLRGTSQGTLPLDETTLNVDVSLPAAPQVAIMAPAAGETLVEGTTVPVTATAASEIGITRVAFTVNGEPVGQYNIPPYTFNLPVPEGVTSLTIGAAAQDTEGNVAVAEVTVNVVPDNRTTVTGRVVDANGNGVVGASVTTVRDIAATSGEDGVFSIPQVPTIYGNISVMARATIAGKPYQGSSATFAPVPGGTTEVGEIEINLVKVWDGGGNGTSWQDARNWNDDVLPSLTDDVYIPATATVTLSSGNAHINSLISDGALVISGGELVLYAESAINNNFTMSGGVLSGAGNLNVQGTLTWTGGSMLGTGATTAASGLVINPPVNSSVVLNRALNNAGVATFNQGGTAYLSLQNMGVFNNLEGATFEIGEGKQVNHSNSGAGPGPVFNNAGTVRKATGTGTLTLTAGVAFHNNGQVMVEAGTLRLAVSGNHAGAFLVSSGATLEFGGGTHAIGGEPGISSAGTIRFNSGTVTLAGSYQASNTIIDGGTVNFNGPASSSTTTFSSGTLGGSGEFTATESLSWSGGTMSGTGVTSIPNTLLLNPANDGSVFLNRTLNNAGTTTFTQGGTAYLSLQNMGVFNNLTGATFEIGDNKFLNHSNSGSGPGPVFNNAGTFRKATGTGTVTFSSGVPFNNTGTMEVASGTMLMYAGGSHSATFVIGNGATLELASGNHSFGTQSSISGGGTFKVSVGTINIAGVYQMNNTVLTGGIVNFNSPATSSTTTLSGGTLSGSSTFTSTGTFTWTGGSMGGGGTTNVAGALVLNPADNGSVTLNRTLNNAGTTTLNQGASGNLSLQNAAVFNNLPGATFTIGDGKQINHSNSGAGTGPVFNNAGIFRKPSGAGGAQVGNSITFHNNGVVEVLEGTLTFRGNGTHTGTFGVAGGAVVEWANGTVAFAPESNVGAAGATLFSGATVTIEGAFNSANAVITSGTVNFNSSATVANLTFSGGTLRGTGALTASNTFAWSQGTMEGPGTTTVPGAFVLAPAVGNNVTLNRTLNLQGSAAWTNPGTISLILPNSSVINVAAGVTFEVGDGKTFAYSNSGAGTGPVFNHAGVLRKAGGSGSATLGSSVRFQNSGSVEVAAGSLIMNSGQPHTGSFTGASGTTMQFSGGHTFGAGTSIASAGRVHFSGGTNNVLGSYNVLEQTEFTAGTTNFTGQLVNAGQTVSVSGTSTVVNFNSGETVSPALLVVGTGTINGSDNIQATTLRWDRGTIDGSGTLVVGTLDLETASGNNVTLGRSLNIASAFNWTSTHSSGMNMRAGTVLTIPASATVTAGPGKTISYVGSGPAPVINLAGTFRKTTGTGTTLVNSGVTFNNSGAVEVQAGTLAFRGGGSHSGSFTGAAGTVLEFSGGHTFGASSTINSAGEVLFSGGTNTLSGSYNVVTATALSGGTTTFGGQLLNVGDTLTITSGTANFTGQLTDIGETLNATSGTVNFNTGATLTPTTVNIGTGTIGGSDNIQVSTLRWDRGTVEGTGTLRVGTLDLVTPSGGYSVTLGRKLDIVSAFNWTNNASTSLNMRAGSSITIPAGATFTVGSLKSVTSSGSGATPVINMAGTFRKTTGAGAATINSGIDFNNSGTVEVQAGTLAFKGGGSQSGSFAGAAGTVLEFSGGHTFTTSSTITSAGEVLFSGGTNTLSGSYNVLDRTTVSTGGTTTFGGQLVNVGNTLTVSAGTANFTGQLTDIGETLVVSGGTATFNTGATLTPTMLNFGSGTINGGDNIQAATMRWDRGTMDGTGTLVVGTLNMETIGGGYSVTLGRKLDIVSALNWNNNTSSGLLMRPGTVLTIPSGATFSIAQGKSVTLTGTGTAPVINNAGTFRKVIATDASAGNGAAVFNNNITFNNSGTVHVQAGTVEFRGGYRQLAGGTTIVEIGGPTVGSQLRRVEVTGLATLDGTLQVNLAGGYEPNVGDSFAVLTYTSRSGQFATIQGLDIGNGKQFAPAYNSNNLTLQVVSAN
jgi:hypothetical protein